MKHYKDPENNLFGLDDDVIPPSNYTEISIGEARQISDSNIPLQQTPDEYVKAMRMNAYVLESDPIFFMSRRGEATEAEWLAKVQEIQERYPYPYPPLEN
jgi:hypothetical protein